MTAAFRTAWGCGHTCTVGGNQFIDLIHHYDLTVAPYCSNCSHFIEDMCNKEYHTRINLAQQSVNDRIDIHCHVKV